MWGYLNYSMSKHFSVNGSVTRGQCPVRLALYASTRQPMRQHDPHTF